MPLLLLLLWVLLWVLLRVILALLLSAGSGAPYKQPAVSIFGVPCGQNILRTIVGNTGANPGGANPFQPFRLNRLKV